MSTAQMFYERDISMNLDLKNQINKSLCKLGYLDLDYDKKCKEYIDYKLSRMIVNGELNYDKPLNLYVYDIKETNEFQQYCNHLNYCQKRFNELKNLTEIKDFYENCTEQELEYLGY
jgi:hypothetical protein